MREQIKRDEWVTNRAASNILGCSVVHVMKLGRDGVLTTRQVPGAWTWFLRSEIEELASKSIRRARRKTEEPAVA